MKRMMTLLLLLALIAATACGSDDEPVTAGDEPDEDPPGALEDTGDHRSVEVIEDGRPRPLVDDTTITLRFADGQLSASAGCNQLGGGYSVDGGVLELEGLSMTEMGCDPARHEQDEWLAEFLSSSPTVEPGGDGFTLATESTTVRFVDREVLEPDAALVGTTWTVSGFLEGDTAMSVATEDPGVLRFEEDGFVSGFDGCNSLGHQEGTDAADPAGEASPQGLRYEVEGDRIRFDGEPVQTMVACDDEDHHERFHAVLSGTVRWEIEASELTLVAEDGRGVTYTADG